jgi:hypothetical protein
MITLSMVLLCTPIIDILLIHSIDSSFTPSVGIIWKILTYNIQTHMDDDDDDDDDE